MRLLYMHIVFCFKTENNKTQKWRLKMCEDNDDVTWYVSLKCSNAMHSIDKNILSP